MKILLQLIFFNILIRFNYFFFFNLITQNLTFIWYLNKKKSKWSKKFFFFKKLFYINNRYKFFFHFFHNYFKQIILVKKKIFKNGFFYIRNLIIIFFIDLLLIDDEPIWEPIEWSLIQTWLLFIFLFSWAIENFLNSKYGLFTGKDKRIWISLYRSYWYFQFWWMFNLMVVLIFVITPFYYEHSYTITHLITWWNWYNQVFLLKINFLLIFILFFNLIFTFSLKWVKWKKIFFFYLFFLFIFFFLFFFNFLIIGFSFFNDISWYQKTRWLNYFELSHGPWKWNWGLKEKDHFTYHRTTINFWFKNDLPFISSVFLVNLIFFIFIFIFILQLIIIVRKIFSFKEISYTTLNYFNSLLKHFFYCFNFFFFIIFFSFFFQYMRLTIDFFFFNWNSMFIKKSIQLIIDLII